MNIVEEAPPQWVQDIVARATGKPVNLETCVYTVGDTLYVPGGGYIDPYLARHEEEHKKQQAEMPHPNLCAAEQCDGSAHWWERWDWDTEFRYAQEVKAYREQYWLYCVSHKDRNERTRYLYALIRDLRNEYGLSEAYTSEEMKKGILNRG